MDKIKEAESDVSDSSEIRDFSKQKKQLEAKMKEAATLVARGLTTGAESMSTVVRKALQAREHVLMVRVNKEAMESINQLKDAGLFRSRSEAAAYLIAEGIAAKSELFGRIMEKIEKINKLKEELRTLAGRDDIFTE